MAIQLNEGAAAPQIEEFIVPQNQGQLVPQAQGFIQGPVLHRFLEVINGVFAPPIMGPIDPPERGLFRVLLPSDFLTASSGPRRIQGLRAAREILKMMHLAFQSLLPEKPHLLQLQEIACDCACQVRAIENLIFAKQVQGNPHIIQLIATALRSAECALSLLSNSLPGIGAGLTTQALLEPIETALPHLRLIDVKILTLSRLLHEVRTEVKPEGGKKLCCDCCGQGLPQAKRPRTVPDKFANCFGSSGLSAKVIFRAQGHLANISSARLIELVQQNNLPIQTLLTANAFKPVSRGEIGGDLNQLPCLFTVEAVLQLAAAHKIDALVVCRLKNHALPKSSSDQIEDHVEEALPCKVIIRQGEGLARLVHTPGCLTGESPFLVIEGLRAMCAHGQLHGHLSQMDLGEIIRENAAAHPQFTDGKAFIPELPFSEMQADAERIHADIAQARLKEIVTLQDQNANELNVLSSCMKTLITRAVQDGCVTEDPRLFLITHIFPCSSKELRSVVRENE